MATTIQSCTPFIPSENALSQSSLPDKAVQLSAASARLAGRLAPATQVKLVLHMEVINSYYSNLIEGNRTLPHEIRAAQQGMLSKDPAKRDLQLESLAHITVQHWISKQAPDLDALFTPEFIQSIHREFYQAIPASLHELKSTSGKVLDRIEPGCWRKKSVTVGPHHPPDSESIHSLMSAFCKTYHPNNFKGDRKIVAAMCAHHRFAWIHPFADGNGRVMRLFTDTVLKTIGLESEGVWCLSRGLACDATQYKSMLTRADNPRKGDLDGRGQLSEHALVEFCGFMLDTAIDQVQYMSELLDLTNMQSRIYHYVQARNDGRIPRLGPLKETASLILYNAFLQGGLKRSVALELCGATERSSRRLLSQLKEEGLLSETSSRSELYWEIPEHAEPWYFPQLGP
ncbi:MAG: Fic family protein [Gammaproteobacteria bacterium]|nr:Fic family protein [Gammaproteobacteria bacterium]